MRVHHKLYSPSLSVAGVLFVDGAVLFLALHKVGMFLGRSALPLHQEHEACEYRGARDADERPDKAEDHADHDGDCKAGDGQDAKYRAKDRFQGGDDLLCFKKL